MPPREIPVVNVERNVVNVEVEGGFGNLADAVNANPVLVNPERPIVNGVGEPGRIRWRQLAAPQYDPHLYAEQNRVAEAIKREKYEVELVKTRRRLAIEHVVAPPYAVGPDTTNDQLMEMYFDRVRKVAAFLDGD